MKSETKYVIINGEIYKELKVFTWGIWSRYLIKLDIIATKTLTLG